jgi:predicted Zn-dependent protease
MPRLTGGWRVSAAAAVLATLLAGCAGDQTGSLSPIMAIPTAELPKVTGLERSAERDHARLVASFGGEYRSAEAQRLVSEITARLVAATERPNDTYQVTILNSPAVNAFALPSGRLYVTRGLLALANDTSEVASVIAHEIAHVTLRHASARTELELKSALVSKVMADVLEDPVAGEMLRDNSRTALASFSRAQELEADQIAVRTLADAGYDPYGATRFLGSLGRVSGQASDGPTGASSADVLATHPGTPERMSLAQQAARRVSAPGRGEAERARFLAVLNGMTYGDDPADGAVRGRRFVHPRLGVAFEAPEGIVLENTSRAVIGASPDGSRRLLFDAIAVAADQGLDGVLRTTWNDAIEVGTIETISVNGKPAAIAASRGSDWAFRLAAVRVGGTTYRLVLAARPGDRGLDQAFRRTLDSLREVTPDEARALRPLRLQVAAAREGDTVEHLASRMGGVDRQLERFLMLNGLARGAMLRPGEPYKLVTE